MFIKNVIEHFNGIPIKHSFISTAVVKAFIVYYFGDVIQSYVYTYSFYIDKTVMERGKWY